MKSSIVQFIQNSKFKIDSNEKVMFYNINKEDTEIVPKESNQVEKEINPDDLPIFNKYNKNDLDFKEFQPKEKLFYCFFAETQVPNSQMINNKYKKIFGSIIVKIFNDFVIIQIRKKKYLHIIRSTNFKIINIINIIDDQSFCFSLSFSNNKFTNCQG